jgi:hypothetical protein
LLKQVSVDIAGGLAIVISLSYASYPIRQGTKVAIAENTRIILDRDTHYHFAGKLALGSDFVTCIEDQVVQQEVGPEALFILYPFLRMDD